MTRRSSSLDAAKRVEVSDRAAWRAWLQDNHQQAEGIWLVFHKKHHPLYLPWEDIVQEALCFGWIDSLPRKLDGNRTMLYICPRKPGSPWSGLNKRHIKQLRRKGLLHPSGLAKIEAAKKDGSWTLLDDVEKGLVPDDLALALDEFPEARAAYASFAPSAQRGLLWWVKSAKTQATRSRRIAKTVEAARRGEVANG